MQMVLHAASYRPEATVMAIAWPLARAVCGYTCAYMCLVSSAHSHVKTLGSTQGPGNSNRVRGQPLLLKPTFMWMESISYGSHGHRAQYPDGTVRYAEGQHGLMHLGSTTN